MLCSFCDHVNHFLLLSIQLQLSSLWLHPLKSPVQGSGSLLGLLCIWFCFFDSLLPPNYKLFPPSRCSYLVELVFDKCTFNKLSLGNSLGYYVCTNLQTFHFLFNSMILRSKRIYSQKHKLSILTGKVSVAAGCVDHTKTHCNKLSSRGRPLYAVLENILHNVS